MQRAALNPFEPWKGRRLFCGVTCPFCDVLDATRSQKQPATSGSQPRPLPQALLGLLCGILRAAVAGGVEGAAFFIIFLLLFHLQKRKRHILI